MREIEPFGLRFDPGSISCRSRLTTHFGSYGADGVAAYNYHCKQNMHLSGGHPSSVRYILTPSCDYVVSLNYISQYAGIMVAHRRLSLILLRRRAGSAQA